MKITKEFSEILGMFAADGCLQNNYICMWGNIHQDKDYYDNAVCPLFSRVFNKRIIAHEKKSNSVYGFYLCGKRIVKLFRNFGFTNNKTYNVQIPKNILESKNKKIHAAFIRGFADCDGGIDFLKRKGKYKSFKLKYNTYPRIYITSVSKKVIKQISSLLDRTKIEHTIIKKKPGKINEKEALRIMIRGPDRIDNFIKKIGFNNPGHYTKYLIWKKFGMCPPETTLEQRKSILQGKKSPFSFYNN